MSADDDAFAEGYEAAACALVFDPHQLASWRRGYHAFLDDVSRCSLFVFDEASAVDDRVWGEIGAIKT